MARIVRRGLRLPGLPLFSLGQPWHSVMNSEGKLALSLYQRQYVDVARRILASNKQFGYAESYPPREGTSGVLALVEDFRWIGEESEHHVPGYGSGSQVQLLSASGGRFRILKTSKETVDGLELYRAHVQLFAERDLTRGAGAEAMAYWNDKTAGPEEGSRATSVKPGSHLVAYVDAPVFESPESWRCVGEVPAGVRVIAMGSPRFVEGYLMVPIVPSGAVRLTLFREPTQEVPEVQLPDGEMLKARSAPSLCAVRRLQQRQDAERSQNALISRVEQLSSGKLHAEQQMREAQSEMHWLRGELARCHRHARSEVQSLGPLDEGHHLDNGTPDVEQPSLRHASWSPPKQPSSSPPSPARHRARASPAHSGDVHCSLPNGSGMSRSSSYKGSSYEPAPHTDEVDEMWRTVLQRFPQHPQWCLVKEKRCVYRMGSQTGKKIVCRVTHGGLQVRVGGGWMAAFPFLERYGPLNMGQKGEDMQYNCTSVDLPPSMERLLVPTKSWAQRIGISKTPDLREQRRLQVDEEDASEAGRPRSLSKRTAWSATAPAECLTSIPQALDGDGLQALQPLPWPGHT
ncbi:unnamed protein product, partial [Symbiodinium sp. CCMP2456]